MGVVPSERLVPVKAFSSNAWKQFFGILVALVLAHIFSHYCIFQTSHTIIKPLRVLNMRMNEILSEENYN